MSEENDTFKIKTSPANLLEFAKKDPVNGGYFLDLPGEQEEVLGSRAPAWTEPISFPPTTGDPFDENGKLKAKPFHPELPAKGTVMGNWAMVVEDNYTITGCGPVNYGTLLYGKPKQGDEVQWLKGKDELKGVEHYCVSYWYGPGGKPGLLMSEHLPPGTLLVGYHVKSQAQKAKD